MASSKVSTGPKKSALERIVGPIKSGKKKGAGKAISADAVIAGAKKPRNALVRIVGPVSDRKPPPKQTVSDAEVGEYLGVVRRPRGRPQNIDNLLDSYFDPTVDPHEPKPKKKAAKKAASKDAPAKKAPAKKAKKAKKAPAKHGVIGPDRNDPNTFDPVPTLKRLAHNLAQVGPVTRALLIEHSRIQPLAKRKCIIDALIASGEIAVEKAPAKKAAAKKAPAKKAAANKAPAKKAAAKKAPAKKAKQIDMFAAEPPKPRGRPPGKKNV
jgi:hypothetical protein